MPMAFNSTLVLISLLLLLQCLSGTHSATFTIINDCNGIIWPALQSNDDGSPPLSTTGFSLGHGESKTITVPANWSGRIWGRTHCAKDSAGKFSCFTGDCGSSAVECGGGNQLSPPATTSEFKLNSPAGPDTYLLSVVNGYNLPIIVAPQGGTGPPNCGTVSCAIDVNSGSCPIELRVTSGNGNVSVGLKSACGAFDEPQYCCTGSYSSKTTCNPNPYSNFFKKWCPQARTFAYDDTSSSFTCQSADYLVRFCPLTGTGTSTGISLTGSSLPEDDDDSDSIYGDKNSSSNFGVWIGVAAGVIGLVLLIWAWHKCAKSECDLHPCTCSCFIFSCSLCADD